MYYRNTSCTFGNVEWSATKTNVYFTSDEVIREVTFYRDINQIYCSTQSFVGLRMATNVGSIYNFGYSGVEYIFTGEGLLNFLGRVGWYIDAVGVQFGKC